MDRMTGAAASWSKVRSGGGRADTQRDLLGVVCGVGFMTLVDVAAWWLSLRPAADRWRAARALDRRRGLFKSSTGATGSHDGYQSGYQGYYAKSEHAVVRVGMGRFELPTPCSQIVKPTRQGALRTARGVGSRR